VLPGDPRGDLELVADLELVRKGWVGGEGKLDCSSVSRKLSSLLVKVFMPDMHLVSDFVAVQKS
jgi:hypothetical protein